MQNQLVKRDEASLALRQGKIVHLFDAAEPHLSGPDEICWCEPEVTQYESGGVLFMHHKVTWQ